MSLTSRTRILVDDVHLNEKRGSVGELETLDEILHRNDWVKLLSLKNPKAPRIVQIERHDRNPKEKPHLIHHVRITETPSITNRDQESKQKRNP